MPHGGGSWHETNHQCIPRADTMYDTKGIIHTIGAMRSVTSHTLSVRDGFFFGASVSGSRSGSGDLCMLRAELHVLEGHH